MRHRIEGVVLLLLWLASGLFCALVLLLALNNYWLIAGPILLGCWALVSEIRKQRAADCEKGKR